MLFRNFRTVKVKILAIWSSTISHYVELTGHLFLRWTKFLLLFLTILAIVVIILSLFFIIVSIILLLWRWYLLIL